MKIGQSHALGMQRIETWRFENRIAMTGQVAVSLVVRDDENNVRRFRRRHPGKDGDADSPPCQHRSVASRICIHK